MVSGVSIHSVVAMPKSNVVSKKEASKSSLSTQTKILIGTGLTVLAAAGIYIATRGKLKTNNIKPGTNLTEPVNTIKEMTLDEFRKAGHKLNRGKAYTSNGELYTGSLKYTRKNGLRYVLEYENGLLIKNTPDAIKMEDFEKLGNKIVDKVAYTADGQKFTGFLQNDECMYKYVKGENNGIASLDNLMQIGEKQYFYSKEGLSSVTCKGFCFEKKIDENVAHISSSVEHYKTHVVYYPGTKTPQYISVKRGNGSPNLTHIYDINGKELDCYTMSLESRKLMSPSCNTTINDSKGNFEYTNKMNNDCSGKIYNAKEVHQDDYSYHSNKYNFSKTGNERIILNNYNGSRYVVEVQKDHGKVIDMILKKDGEILTKETEPKLYNEIIQKAKDVKTELIAKTKQVLRTRNDVILKSKES